MKLNLYPNMAEEKYTDMCSFKFITINFKWTFSAAWKSYFISHTGSLKKLSTFSSQTSNSPSSPSLWLRTLVFSINEEKELEEN